MPCKKVVHGQRENCCNGAPLRSVHVMSMLSYSYTSTVFKSHSIMPLSRWHENCIFLYWRRMVLVMQHQPKSKLRTCLPASEKSAASIRQGVCFLTTPNATFAVQKR